MAPLLPAGARFVLIDGALTRVTQTIDEIGLPFNWKVGPTSRNIGDPSYLQVSHAFRGEGLKPLSPVHVRGERDSGGSLSLSWTRRSRSGGDTWETAEVPLVEASERYEVDILDGTTVKRTIATTGHSAAYPAADQIADFGSLQGLLDIRVCQLSEMAGRGAARAARV